jgi:Ger(x)C family germination protein
MLKRYRILICIVLVIAGLIYFNPSNRSVSIEKLNILSAIGVDLVQEYDHRKKYELTISSYTFLKKDQVSSEIISGEGNIINETRSHRQIKDNRKYLTALERVVVLGENKALSGLKEDAEILFSNQFSNDMGWMVVYKGEAKELLSQVVDGYPSSGDYIDGLIDNSKEYHYYSDNYKLMDVFATLDEEGRNLVLPYIESKGGEPKITGMALFKKYKMVKKINIGETRIMNMLRENSGRGSLEYIVDKDHLISSYGQVSRKVYCKKVGSQYTFDINLTFTENIVNNTLYKDILYKTSVIKKYERDIEEQTKKQCEDFIKNMQNNYKVDCLELGRVACAKYGRDMVVDWNEEISNAKINVNIKVKVRSLGRGRYAQ